MVVVEFCAFGEQYAAVKGVERCDRAETAVSRPPLSL